MANITGFKNLIFWKEAKILVVLVYKLTNRFPRSEEFGLKSQMRRAAVSILSNFAEGWLRRSVKEKYLYLEISQGSIMELDAQGEIAFEVKYWDELSYELFEQQKAKVVYLLSRYMSKIN